MRVASAQVEGAPAAVRVDGERATVLPFADVAELLASGDDWQRRAAESQGADRATAELSLAPVVPRPEKILCAGLNYRAHVLESGRPMPDYPPLFTKFWRSLVGPNDEIVLPPNSDMVDWEAELALVIGLPVRHADLEQARAAIAGYTVANDVSMRDWQRRTTEMTQGKAWERSTPLGPVLVTADELDDARDLRLRCSVDGVTMQDASTADLIFDPPTLVSYISGFITLVPGDVILTGTPSGVGGARKPPVYLQPGQTLRTSVEGLGELVNLCVKEGSDGTGR
jgi:acylpyruvate hydrolase